MPKSIKNSSPPTFFEIRAYNLIVMFFLTVTITHKSLRWPTIQKKGKIQKSEKVGQKT